MMITIQAISDDLAPQEAEHVAGSCGWVITPEPVRLLLTRCFGGVSIRSCLEHPFVGGCEVEEAGWIAPGPRFLHHLQAGGLGLAVSTGSAYQYDLALTFTAALCRRHPELTPLAADLDRSVHELVANAVVHGNLGVTSPRPGLEGFDSYCKALDAALADPGRLGRRVEISALYAQGAVEIAVRDHGGGYAPHEVTRLQVDAVPHQHGLAIITSVAELSVEDGGRCAVLRLAVSAPPSPAPPSLGTS